MIDVVTLVNVIGIIPLLLWLVYKKKLVDTIKFLLPFVVLMAFASIYEEIGTHILQINNQVWFRIYSLFEFLTLFYFFRNSVKRNRIVFKISLAIYMLFYVGFLYYWNSIDSLIIESYIAIIETIIIYIYAILWIKQLFEDYEKESVLELSTFYFITAILIYLSGTLILYVLSNSMLISNELRLSNYWFLIVLFTFLLRIIIIYGFWKGRLK